MSPQVLAALLAFQAEYLAATGPANSKGYCPSAVLDRIDLCNRTHNALKGRAFKALRAFIDRCARYEEMALYEWDVTCARGERIGRAVQP